MTTYAQAIHVALDHLLATHSEVFVIGQGLWSPWYVGSTMKDLDLKYGRDRVIDTPVSESASTGIGVGAALLGSRPVVVHPRVDFALLAIDPIVNQAAKWTGMFGPDERVPVTVRAIINRGGSQGAQHSQSLYSWFAHIPGLRVVVPATPSDARDLLVASVLSDDPVLYFDDRWLYELDDPNLAMSVETEIDLRTVKPKILREGDDLTIVGCGFGTLTALRAAEILSANSIRAEVVDLRVINPFDHKPVIESVENTGRLLVVDGDWAPCGVSAEVIAAVSEVLNPSQLRCAPVRLAPKFAAAPTAVTLEDDYYVSTDAVVCEAENLVS